MSNLISRSANILSELVHVQRLSAPFTRWPRLDDGNAATKHNPILYSLIVSVQKEYAVLFFNEAYVVGVYG
jgi:hypothetical protein